MDDVENVIIDALMKIMETDGRKAFPSKNSPLMGQGGLIDSMGLVELCLILEDYALDLNFEFDWASEKAMSSTKSIFRSVETLAAEFKRQKDSAQ